MNPILVEYTITKDGLVAYFKHLINQGWVLKYLNVVVAQLIILGVCIFLAVVHGNVMYLISLPIVLEMIYLLVTRGRPVQMSVSIWADMLADHVLERHFPDETSRQVTIEVSDVCRVISQKATIEMPLNEVSARIIEPYIHLKCLAAVPVMIPMESFSSPQEMQDFLQRVGQTDQPDFHTV